MNKSLCALALSCFFVAGCATANAPTSASTLAEAEQSATLATKAVDVYVNSASVNRADLLKIQQGNNVIHSALLTLEADRKAGTPLSFSAFNAAVASFNSYLGK